MRGQLPSCCAGRWRALCRGGYGPAGCCRRCCCCPGCRRTLLVCATHRYSAACPQASGPVKVQQHSICNHVAVDFASAVDSGCAAQSGDPTIVSVSNLLVACVHDTATCHEQMLAAQDGGCLQGAVLLVQGNGRTALPLTCSEWVREASEALWLCRPRMVGSAGTAAVPPDIRASTSRACAC